MRRLATLLLAPLLLLAAPAAQAHSFLDHARPSVGSTVQRPPNDLSLWFSTEIEPAFASLEVRDQAGRRVDQGDARVDDRDATRLRASLPPLPPGLYKVIWRVLSVDSHPTQGDFTFRVTSK
jgi:methionine-rich copper-binding protein CopC